MTGCKPKGNRGRRGIRAACLLGLVLPALWLDGAWAQSEPDPASLDNEPAANVPAPAQPGEAPRADRAKPVVWRLQIDAPSPLDKLLRNYLDLARFQEESSKDQSLGIRRSELRRLVVSAPDQARALLEAEGYFNAHIVTRVSDEVEGQPVVVSMEVDPGPQTVVSKVQFVFEGDLDTRLGNSDPLAQALLDRLERNWALPEGQVFRQADWSAAKNGALARMRAEGYPLASWSGTSVTVDAQTRQAKIFLVADSGTAVAFGDIKVEGLNRQPASAVINLAPFHKGDPYSEKQLLDWQERIQKLNMFDNVFVTTDLDPTQAQAAPVLVQLHELPMQTATTGVGISSDTGPRVSGEHVHRNIFGLDWQSKAKVQIGRKESTGQLDLTSHPWPGRRRGLISAQGSYLLDDNDAVTTSQYLRVGLLREGERLERTDYLEFQRAEVRSSEGLVVSNASAVSGTSQWIFRDVDSQILPTKGSTSLAQLTGGRSYSALNEPGYFGRAYARVTGYLPLWSHWYATARAEVGQVFARDAVSVPDTLLFRAGGDDSVRGYAYRSLGVLNEGVVVGGRSMSAGSLELAHPLSSKMPSLWGALFIDAGDAANRFGDLQPKVGYGAGIRWRSPVGPLRLDLAYGNEVQRWRMHFSVGISL
ncbi:MAG TPA: BamA/TamA family outer membrane protein [Aquabacterium sp.]|uniref:autotransporter assembly complex protein TamA n=1 Tax=Aquabacterium sp. TaxID=1872578 RepID=UPI002E371632|nr:BamA/TamA family outer membrane protein [Aquabacterium sp.]HEX5355666.1 BamA/TamA family outer membrane protein [Aquabacterium sp.]